MADEGQDLGLGEPSFGLNALDALKAERTAFDAIDRRDFRVVERGKDVSLSMETRYSILILSDTVGEKLDLNVTVKLGVGALAHSAHAGFAQLGEDSGR